MDVDHEQQDLDDPVSDESGYTSDADELYASSESQCQEQQWCDRCYFAGVSLEEMEELQKLDYLFTGQFFKEWTLNLMTVEYRFVSLINRFINLLLWQSF